MAEDKRTEAELVELAREVQDACNLSAVVHAFSRAMTRLWEIAREQKQGTDWVNQHRVCRLFGSKIVSLAGEPTWEDFG